jgi:hypothetical protein
MNVAGSIAPARPRRSLPIRWFVGQLRPTSSAADDSPLQRVLQHSRAGHRGGLRTSACSCTKQRPPSCFRAIQSLVSSWCCRPRCRPSRRPVGLGARRRGPTRHRGITSSPALGMLNRRHPPPEQVPRVLPLACGRRETSPQFQIRIRVARFPKRRREPRLDARSTRCTLKRCSAQRSRPRSPQIAAATASQLASSACGVKPASEGSPAALLTASV